MFSCWLLRRSIRNYLSKSWEFIHKKFFLMLAKRIVIVVVICSWIIIILRRQKLMASISPFRTFLIHHLLFMKFFMWGKIIISMLIIYVLIMLINKDIHLLRLYDIFFKDNISCVIIPDSSLALFIIIQKIDSLSAIIRYRLLWLVFNKGTA